MKWRKRTTPPGLDASGADAHGDLADVRGQAAAKRALEIAAAGGHNLLLVGPPGCGKTMLARRLPSILPPMTLPEALEVTKIYSVAGFLTRNAGIVRARPFRFPHHTISQTALVGGGALAKPGEISLAHHGVLFLDELPEFARSAIEVMRQPLEEGTVSIAHAAGTFTYPARFRLVASMNPCPCGYRGTRNAECRCDDAAVAKYVGKLSGPLLDRIDLQIEIARVPFDDMVRYDGGEKSSQIRVRAVGARERQSARFVGSRWRAMRKFPRSTNRRCGCSRSPARSGSSPLGHSTASHGSRAPSPTSATPARFAPSTSPKASSTAASSESARRHSPRRQGRRSGSSQRRGVHVREARPAEFPLLEKMPHALHYEHHLSFIRHALGTKKCLVAEIDGAIAGFVVWDRGFYARSFLWMLGVDPAHQHLGVASELIEHVERLNAGHGVYTSTNESNAVMQQLLAKRGFAQVGQLENLDPGDPEVFFFKKL